SHQFIDRKRIFEKGGNKCTLLNKSAQLTIYKIYKRFIFQKLRSSTWPGLIIKQYGLNREKE
ncbi:MAG: hypothetical protein ACTTHI_06300, partial [Prevotella sp.]